MKSTVEKLSPTRVRINVEVPFTELEPDIDRAFKALAKQIRLPGFRPGKAPRKLLEARVGRGAVLEQVVNDALPGRYSEAVTAESLQPIGQPEIEITKLEDNEELVFTAEVDIRPEIELPELSALKITVDPIEIADDDVDAELESLQKRFGTLTGVERAAQDGDFVSIDLSATVDGEDVPGGQDRRAVPRGGLRSADRGSRRGDHRPLGGRVQGLRHHAGRRRARRPGGRGHRHRQVGQGTRAARAGRRIRPTGKRIRHHRGAACRSARAGRAGSSASQQAEQIRDKAIEELLEPGRGPAAREGRAGPGRRHPAQRHPRARPRRGRSSRRRSPSRAAAARSSTPTTAATRRRPSRPSC